MTKVDIDLEPFLALVATIEQAMLFRKHGNPESAEPEGVGMPEHVADLTALYWQGRNAYDAIALQLGVDSYDAVFGMSSRAMHQSNSSRDMDDEIPF